MGMLSVKDKSFKNDLIKKFVTELAPSPKQLLNGQEVRKISALQKFEISFEEVRSFCGRGTEVCEQLREK